MPSPEVLLAFTLAALVMNLSPGPSNLYVMARSLAQGAPAGLVATAGLAAGSLVHVLAAVLGLAAIFEYSPVTYTAVRVLGALYLVYLGIGYWRAEPALPGQAPRVSARSPGKIFRESLLVELTNPKTALFFLALLPQFVNPAAGPVAPQMLLLGLIVTLTAMPCDILVALSTARLAAWLGEHPGALRVQERVSASILVGLGTWLLATEFAAKD